MKKKNESEGFVAHKRDYQVEIKYSEEAKKNKLIRFTAKRKNREFVISVDEFINMIMMNINKEEIPMLRTVNDTVQMIEVERSISGVADKDFKKGEPISFNYLTKIPLEMAIAEEAYKLCAIRGDIEVIPASTLTEAQKEITERQKQYIQFTYAEFLKKQQGETPPDVEEAEQEKLEKALDVLSPYFENKEDNK